PTYILVEPSLVQNSSHTNSKENNISAEGRAYNYSFTFKFLGRGQLSDNTDYIPITAWGCVFYNIIKDNQSSISGNITLQGECSKDLLLPPRSGNYSVEAVFRNSRMHPLSNLSVIRTNMNFSLNAPPIAYLSTTHIKVRCNESILLNASSSFDPDGELKLIYWDTDIFYDTQDDDGNPETDFWKGDGNTSNDRDFSGTVLFFFPNCSRIYLAGDVKYIIIQLNVVDDKGLLAYEQCFVEFVSTT
ncbi:MAG: hypothetical protein QW728_04940, partial [Thermoplasmata archaeon]